MMGEGGDEVVSCHSVSVQVHVDLWCDEGGAGIGDTPQ